MSSGDISDADAGGLGDAGGDLGGEPFELGQVDEDVLGPPI